MIPCAFEFLLLAIELAFLPFDIGPNLLKLLTLLLQLLKVAFKLFELLAPSFHFHLSTVQLLTLVGQGLLPLLNLFFLSFEFLLKTRKILQDTHQGSASFLDSLDLLAVSQVYQ